MRSGFDVPSGDDDDVVVLDLPVKDPDRAVALSRVHRLESVLPVEIECDASTEEKYGSVRDKRPSAVVGIGCQCCTTRDARYNVYWQSPCHSKCA